MDPDHSLYEPLAIEKSAVAKLRAGPVSYMNAVSCFIVFCLCNFYLAVILLSLNASTMMLDNIGERMRTMYEPTCIFLFGICVQIQSVCGIQALSIFGLCLILGLVVLLNWTGRLGVGFTVCIAAMTFLRGIPDLLAMICEVSLVMTSGPSKLRSEILFILVHGFIPFYVVATPLIFYLVCSYHKKSHDEGREVPWFFSAITFRILKTINASNFISLMTKVRYLPINALFIFGIFKRIEGLLVFVHGSFLHGTSYDCERVRTTVQPAISGVITVSIILSNTANGRLSFSKLGSTCCQDIFTYLFAISLIIYALFATQMIILLVAQAAECSAGNWLIVRKPVFLIVYTMEICACIYYKETIAPWLRLATGAQPPPPPSPIEAITLLVDNSCESQSTDRCTTSLL